MPSASRTEVDTRCEESWATLFPLLREHEERVYASMSDRKLADAYRRDDEAAHQLMDTLDVLREQGRHLPSLPPMRSRRSSTG